MRVVLVLAAAMSMVLAIPSVAAGAAEVDHVLRQFAMGANLFADDCPLEIPVTDVACTGYTVYWFREDQPQGGLDPTAEAGGRSKAPWTVLVVIDDVVVHADGSVDGTNRAAGITTDATGTFHRLHLTGASVRASVPMSDGSTVPVDLTWTPESPYEVHGNDGPLAEQNGFPARHLQDPCTTANLNDHQKFVFHARIRGSVDGRDVAGLNADGSLFNNWFHWTFVTHGNCT